MASITSEIASSSSLPKWEYDVFLSFRGEDTRNNFTDHLYAALDQKGIWTFRDEERLERGTTISTELLNAIEKSKFAIIVLSRNYASSSWCLDELVKIVECKEKTRLTILPVFHGVDPSDVRHQRGSFAEAFAKHELIKNEEKLQSWRAALTQVADLSGWDTLNKKESTIIEEIVRKLIGGLHYSYSVREDLVGIQSRVEEMENLYLSMGLNDVHFIGIWGMGGIGKTTIAQILYDRIRYHFAGSSFLENVRERSQNDGLVSLQKQLLSDVLFEKNIDISNVQWGINLIRNRLCHKRVLVILDDVDQPKQLEALVGKQSWFGRGSVVIIITRNQRLLITHEVVEEKIYKPEILNSDEALKLFSLKAFKQDNPLKGYEVLSEEFVYYAQGLPLALKVLGSFMFHRNLDAWESVLGRLKETPKRDIMDVLQISFDGLEITEKKIFLDIACFFKGMTKDCVANILRTPHYKPIIEIDVLVEKSLIIISNGTLWMHDLIQELGKEIVRCESPDEPGERSRLWLKKDILRVLKDNEGTKKVEGIFINTPSKEEDLNIEEKVEDLNAETFSEMRNLRLLKICNVGLPQGLNSLSSDLRLMDWPECPLKFMPKNFNPDKLVELIMPRSLIKQLWEGNWELCYRESTKKGRFDVVIPGSEVPNWFRHQSVGASVNLEVPSNLFKQFRGIVLCAVFGPHQHRPRNPHHDIVLWVYVVANNGKDKIIDGIFDSFLKEFDTVESDHRWFMYFPLDCFRKDFRKADGSSCQLEIGFVSWDPEIKKCGAHIIYEEEMEDLKQSMGQSECSSSIIPYNESIDHFEEDIKSKRSRDDENENGASGEGSSTHIPHPKTKRVRPSNGE